MGQNVGDRITMTGERRCRQRYSIALPVDFDHGFGTTKDISEHGFRFVTTESCNVGQRLTFTLRFRHVIYGERAWRFTGVGRVVRVERHGIESMVAVAVGQYAIPEA